MKYRSNIGWSFILGLMMLVTACSTTKEVDNEVEDELQELRSWVSTQSTQLADQTEDDWERAKQDFRNRTRELDQKEDNLSEELKQDYKQLKQQFIDLDEKYKASRSQTDNAEWEKNLLKSYADLSTVSQANVREVYIAFMENVRQQNGTWSNEDWDKAKLVLEKLDARKDEIDDGLATDDEVKIRALQMEFRTMENAADIGIN